MFDTFVTKRNLLIAGIIVNVITWPMVVAPLYFPVISLVVFSLITYPIRDGVFKLWARFTVPWMLLFLLSYLPSYDFFHSIGIQDMDKFVTSFFELWIYVVISSLLIVVKFLSLKPLKK